MEPERESGWAAGMVVRSSADWERRRTPGQLCSNDEGARAEPGRRVSMVTRSVAVHCGATRVPRAKLFVEAAGLGDVAGSLSISPTSVSLVSESRWARPRRGTASGSALRLPALLPKEATSTSCKTRSGMAEAPAASEGVPRTCDRPAADARSWVPGSGLASP
jgi:hypothetical protein